MKPRKVCKAEILSNRAVCCRKMNKVNVALFFAALMVIGACAEPRKLLATTEGRELVEAEEHQRILAELEEVHQLRERMLQAGTQSRCSVLLVSVAPAY
jgi:hypothetical protein